MANATVILSNIGGELERRELPIGTDGCFNFTDDTGRHWMLRPGDTLRVLDEETLRIVDFVNG